MRRGTPRHKSLVGQVFGRLTVVESAGTNSYQQMMYLCRCVCGNQKVVPAKYLRSGESRSCGCLEKGPTSVKFQHGYARKGENRCSEYWIYRSAKKRCNDPSNPAYCYYGERGIEMRFDSAAEFIAELGPRPSKKHSVDRINNDGHYEPGNIRWATAKQQAQNKRPRGTAKKVKEHHEEH